MDAWDTLNSELDEWLAKDSVADFWWRDDDAVAASAELDKLLSVTTNTGLLLAVIPAKVEKSLLPKVKEATHVTVAQHGYAHINHAKQYPLPEPQPGAWELGLHRGERVILEELSHGRELLEDLFNDDFAPVLVPPWNRMDPALLPAVVEMGFSGVSRFGPRCGKQTAPGFTTVNSHCDLLRWKGGAAFKGAEKTINQLVEHLRDRRAGAVDASEPTGYLTHHLVMQDECWAFSQQLADAINNHPAARWHTDVGGLFRTNL